MALSDLPLSFRLNVAFSGLPELGYTAPISSAQIQALTGSLLSADTIYVRLLDGDTESLTAELGIGGVTADTRVRNFSAEILGGASVLLTDASGTRIHSGKIPPDDTSEPYGLPISDAARRAFIASDNAYLDLVIDVAPSALETLVSLPRPSIGAKTKAPPLQASVSLPPAELHRRGGIYARAVPVAVAPGRPRFTVNLRAAPLAAVASLSPPDFHRRGSIYARPLPVGISLLRPSLQEDLDAGALATAVSLARPRFATSAELQDRRRISLRATSPEGRIVTAIELTHPAALQPARLVDDTGELVVDGDTYLPARFDAALPDDLERKSPTATISIGNVGRALTDWIEATDGGAGGELTLMQVSILEGAASIDWQLTMDIAAVSQDADLVTVTLGFDPFLSLPSVALRYDPETAPGLF